MTPTYIVTYEGKDVSKDFAPYLESISFKECLENKAAELELVFTNAEAYFLNDWYPGIDDKIQAKLGFKEGQLINCGLFFVDDVTLSGSRMGDITSFRALSAYGSSIYSEEVRKNHEGKSVQSLVSDEAIRLGYSAKGDLSGNWSGLQKGTGLKFLEQIARETGRVMKVEGTDLYFIPMATVKSGAIVGTVNKADVISYTVTDKASGRISNCTVKFWDKTKKQLITGDYNAGIKGGGSRTIWEQVDDVAAAKEKAKNFVEDWNKTGSRIELTIPGDVRYRAGVRVNLEAFGRFSKTWYVDEVSHSISKSQGYQTTIIIQE
jgi:phage protein D